MIVDPNPDKSFDTAVYPDRKIIVFLFAEDSGTGAYAITKDGVAKKKSQNRGKEANDHTRPHSHVSSRNK